MTQLEITDARTQLLDKNKELFTAAKAEKRSLNADEKAIVQSNLEQVEQFDLELRSLGFTEKSGKLVTAVKRDAPARPSFSLIKAINDKIENRNHSDVDRDVFTYGKQEFRKAGLSPAGDIVIPSEIRANILAGTATAGQEIVAEDKKAIIPPLVDKLIFSQAGATFMTGLVGNVSIPSYAGTSVLWKSEVEAAVDGGGAFSEVEFSPKRLTAFILVSKLFLAQDGVGAEKLLLEKIANAVARKLEATILGVADGSATQPQGMGYKITTGADTKANAIVPTLANMIALETAVDVSNALDGNLAYITNGGGRGILKSIDKGVANDTGDALLENGLLNGYPVLVTNGASAVAGDDDIGDLVAFGNWADLCIAQWGGYDITVDPYTAAATNQVKITINAYFDAKGLRGSYKTDEPAAQTSPDNYAFSFATAAIKAS
jgi:HK97 family phage major capsid protein